MQKEIESFIDDLKSNKRLSSFDQASTKQAVVLRMLSFLGWDIFNVEEVYPDYTVNSHSVSYALHVKNSAKIFIEVKPISEKLDNHQRPLVTFAVQESVDLSILTNGIVWWFYLISAKGDWQQKWFHSIDLFKQKSDVIVPPLLDLLNKTRVSKGKSLKAAEELYQNKKQKMAAENIPHAWNQILSGPNKIFVELLSDTTEKLCGYKVESNQVENFLMKHLDKWLFKDLASLSSAPPAKIHETPIIRETKTVPKPSGPSPAPATPPAPAPLPIAKKLESYEGKTIKSFIFNGRTYTVNHWEEILTILCDYFVLNHKKDFERVLWISGENKTYFSRYQDQLRIPEKIRKTDIYVETKLSPDEIVKTSRSLLEEFGYSRDLFKINTN